MTDSMKLTSFAARSIDRAERNAAASQMSRILFALSMVAHLPVHALRCPDINQSLASGAEIRMSCQPWFSFPVPSTSRQLPPLVLTFDSTALKKVGDLLLQCVLACRLFMPQTPFRWRRALRNACGDGGDVSLGM